ncbi:MAG: MFS transporter [Candidatus Thorarchaeota archaeon]
MAKKGNLYENRSQQEVSKFLQVIIFLLFGFGPVMGNVILVLFGVLSKEFNATPSTILIAIPAFMFPFAFIQLFSGAISDVKGRFPVILFGLVIFGIGMIVAATSFSFLMFVVANILGGIGFGFVNPVLIALITDITKGAEIPKRIGYLGAVANLGVGLGPLLAGQMIVVGWRYLYVLFVLITIFSFIVLITIKQPPQKVDKDAGLRLFFTHLHIEIRRPLVILMILSAFLTSQTYLATLIWSSRAFTGAVNEAVVGLILFIVGVIAAISGIVGGHLIKKKGVGIALLLGLLSLLIGVSLLLILGDITRSKLLIYVAIGLIIVAVAGGMLFPTFTYYSQIFSPERRGALAGLATAGYFIGNALVPVTYTPFFNFGGITAVYMGILIVTILLIFSVGLLYILAKHQHEIILN